VFDDAQPLPWTAFNTGYISGALKNNAQPESFPAHRNPADRYEYAVMAFHFRHPTHGDILIDDGTLWAISTLGHTRDHLAYLINTSPAPVLVVGDAELTAWAMKDEILVSTIDGARGKQQVQRSATMIRTCPATYPQVQIWFSHDEDHL
jgi:hypothetical protein